MEYGVAAVTLEAPDVPLAIERDQRLAFPQLVSAASTGTRVGMPIAGSSGTGAITNWCGGLADRYTDASMTERLTYEQCTVS